LANFSPGFASTLGLKKTKNCNAEGVDESVLPTCSRTLSELDPIDEMNPGLNQPWARISQRFQR